MFIASGSPKRALNSMTFSPAAVTKKPVFSTPENDRPRARHFSAISWMNSHAARYRSSLRNGRLPGPSV